MQDSLFDTNQRTFCKVYVDDILIDHTELQYFTMGMFFGGKLPTLDMVIATQEEDTFKACISECNRVFIEFGNLDKNGVKQETVKAVFIIMQPTVTLDIKSNKHVIRLFCTSDIVDKDSLLGTSIKLSNNSKAVEFIEQLIEYKAEEPYVAIKTSDAPTGWSLSSEALQVKDMLKNRSIDSRTRNLSSISKLEAINEVVANSLISSVDGKSAIGHYLSFDDSGALKLTLFDLVLRCKQFPTDKTKVLGVTKELKLATYLKDGYIMADSMQYDSPGGSYSASFWKRPVDSYNQAERVPFTEEVKTTGMFSDSASYEDMPIFRSNMLLKKETENSDNVSDIGLSSARATYKRYTKALTKVNFRITIKNLLKVDVSNIVEILYGNHNDTSNPTKHKLLSSKYMITSVWYNYSNQGIKTYLIASRDSFVKDS